MAGLMQMNVLDFATRPRLESWQSRFWLFLACVLPSLGIALKFGKERGLLLYVLAAALWIGFLLPVAVRRANQWPHSEKYAWWGAATAVFLFAALFLVIYPLSHSGRFGKGTDRADALNISIPRLIAGRNPYTVRTFLNNPVTPLPGALILGAPFRLVFRDAAYQNIVWIFALFLLLCAVAATRVEAFLLWITVIFLCPVLLDDMMTGGDFVTNAIYCAVSTYLLLQAVEQADTPGRRRFWQWVPLAAFWGVCLCSRPTYLVLVPLVFATVVHRRNWTMALGLTGVALVVYAALVLPIYLPDPQDFSPLHLGGKLMGPGKETLLVKGEAAATALGLLLTAWLGRRLGTWFVFAAAAVFLVLPVPLLLLTTMRQTDHAEMADLLYAEAPAIFLVVALATVHRDKMISAGSS